jgi:CheY-like chemotaxis protein
LLGRTLGATIRVTTTATHEAGMAFADPAALEAAVLNVALNARDAMPDGGALTIRTSTATIVTPPRNDDDLAAGRYALIEIDDTGSGMPPEVLARVFEPFFTTKGSGRGTGLGLSMVYGFARQSGGTVTVTSSVDRGTTVKLFLPLAASEPLPETVELDPVGKPAIRRTVLVVEDEADVRHVVRRQLENLGHSVLVAEGATEALLLLQGPGAPDVLLTDIVLATGMSGLDLAESARALRPGLPLIFMSGHTAVPEARRRIRDTGAPLLSKPFTSAQLERAVTLLFT